MKQFFETPEVKILWIQSQDVISTSGDDDDNGGSVQLPEI